jgi:hypothetical protein
MRGDNRKLSSVLVTGEKIKVYVKAWEALMRRLQKRECYNFGKIGGIENDRLWKILNRSGGGSLGD